MTGTLGLFSLVDLFQLLAASSRSGRLTVDHPKGAARVYFEEGLAVHAEFADRSGEDAVYALFADEQGSFEFMLGVPAPRTTISTRTENLILEASRRLDESRRGESGSAPPPGGAATPAPARPAAPEARPPTTPPAHEPAGERPSAIRPGDDAGGRPAAAEGAARPATGGSPQVPASRRSAVTPPKAPPAAEVTTTGSGSGVTLTSIPAFAEKAKTVADMSLSKEEVEFLRAVDGKRNVGQIAQEAAVADERARSIVERFVELGVLRLSNRKPRTARLVTHLTKTKLPHGIAGVDPSIMSAWEKSLGHPAQSIACRREDGRVCLLGAMPLDNAGPYLMINRETLMHADLAVNQPLLVKPVQQNEV
ncbi:MAG TPA: DUF4388 domain-containing protein [Trueperaceae bacterium]